MSTLRYSPDVDPEVIAILTVGLGLAGLLLSIRADIKSLTDKVAALAERVAHIEGAFGGFRPPPPASRSELP